MKHNQMPFISVILPMYNAENFIEETIKTVLNQTYQNFEILIVDDCSNDKSVNIVESLMKEYKNIKLYKNTENLGVAISRNRAVKNSNGRFICYLDADDLWLPNKLEKQLNFALQNDCAFSFTGYEFATSTGEKSGKIVNPPKTINYKEALRNHTIFTSTVMLDLSKLKKEDVMMPNVRRGQDTATWWKILKITNKAFCLQEPLSLYRRTNSSLSSNKLKAIKRTWYLFRKVERLTFIQTIIPFIGYAYNAVKRRM